MPELSLPSYHAYHEGVPSEFSYRGWRYWTGPAGMGAYTTTKDEDGNFYSFFLKKAGKGARSNNPEYYVYVPRLTSKRKQKKAAMRRSFNLAYGKPINSGTKANNAVAMVPGTGYCMKEKKSVFVEWEGTILAKNDREMIYGSCPDCGTKIQKYGKLGLCPSCDQTREMAANDYICRFCRYEQEK